MQRRTQEMMMAAKWMAIMAMIAFLKASTSNGGKKDGHPTLKDEQEDCLPCHANLEIETWIWNDDAVGMCENTIVEQMLRALELGVIIWPWIEVRRSRKKIEKLTRSTIGFSGNKNDRLLVYSKAQYSRGINKTRALESN